MTEPTPDGIAIIALHGRFPGAKSVEEFWDNLVAGRESISFFDDAELATAGLDPASLKRAGQYVSARGVLKDAEYFDAAFFGIHPKEAEVMDPQHRVFLEACWEALERAGYAPGRIRGAVGVYSGATFNTYYLNALHPRPELRELVGSEQVMLGNEKDYLATRVAYKLDLKGPAISLDTACSSSLVAVCQACQALLTYQCDMALAGGVSVKVPQQRGYFYQDGNIASPDGHTRTFDATARGTAFSNGVTLVVLKRLAEAINDGDEIYAVIKGAALNNDGSQRVSFGAPGVEGQSEVVSLAQELAGVEPDSISYVEAHGTATPIGDPIEVAALTKAFRRGTPRKQFCALGSVKSNVGHLDAAAGTAGLIKTALALKHRLLPPSLHFQSPNPKLDLANSPFFVNAKLREWKSETGAPLRAGVSSFGTGGTNAHVIVEQAPPLKPASASRPWQMLLLSAKTAEALESASSNLAAHLGAQPEVNLPDVAYTLQVGRSEFAQRRMVLCQTVAEAVTVLEKRDGRKVFTARQELKNPPVVFMFPGQGAQYVNMGADVYRQERVFREAVDRCATILEPLLGLDLRKALFAPSGSEDTANEQLRQTRLTQPALFTIEYALAQLWMSWGVKPAAMIGHSVGEHVAACLGGVYPLETALMLVARRAELVQAQPPGSMLAVRLPEAEVQPLLNDSLSLAAINSPKLCVVSGPNEAIAQLEKQLSEQGVAAKRLHTSHAFHSAMMDPVLAPYTDLLRSVKLQEPQIPYVSNVTAKWITGAEATSPEYWAGHVRQTVRFAEGVAEIMKDSRHVLLEVGPGQTLSQLSRQHPARKEEQPVIATLGAAREQELPGLLGALGRLWLAGTDVDWPGYYGEERRRRVVLPTYPFDRKRYWPETPVTAPVPLPDQALPAATPNALSGTVIFEEAMPSASSPFLISRREHLADLVRSLTQDLSGTNLDGVEMATSFLEIGLDSLLLTQAATVFQRKFGVAISFRQLMEDLATIDALAGYLDEQLPPGAFSPIPVLPPPAPLSPAHSNQRMASPGAGASSGSIEQLLEQQMQTTAQLLALVRGPVGGVTGWPPLQEAPKPAATKPPPTARPAAHGPFRPMERGSTGDLTEAQQKAIAAIISRYTRRTAGSKRLAAQNRPGLADPRSVAGFKQPWKEMVYPIYTTRSEGSRVWDVDGNEYIDFVNGFGASLFGHRPPFVIEAILRQLELGFEIGPIQPMVGEAAALVRELTGMERVAFCNTGSEAVLAAMRMARTVTGRDRIATFAGDYHGIFDEVLYRPHSTNGQPGAAPIAPGIPGSATGQLVVLEYGSLEALEWLRQNAHELAAVMVEPVQSRRLDLQPREFLHEVRRITERSNTALIFDEVVTGFRVHPGGAQAHFGVRADIATYGKVIGGGLPIGVVAGSSKYLDALDGGNWQFGDASFPEVGVTFFAGTFVRHPIAIAVAKAVLEHLKREGSELQQRVADLAGRAATAIREVIDRRRAPLHLTQFSSLMYITIRPESKQGGLLFYLLRERGIHIFENRTFVFTTAHTDADVDKLVKAIDEGLTELSRAELIDASANALTPLAISSKGEVSREEPMTLDLTDAQREMWLGALMDDNLARAFNVSFLIKMRGALDREALERAWQLLIDRHDSLRTSFDRNRPLQLIFPRARVSLLSTDLSGMPMAERDAELTRLIAEQTNRLMDLSQAPLLRLRLVKISDDEHTLILTVHHIIADGWSIGVLFHELNVAYSANCDGSPVTLEPALQFEEYARWCDGSDYQQSSQTAEAYWKDVYKTAPSPVDLPTDRARPWQRTYSADREYVIWDNSFVRSLRKAAGRHGTTLQNFLLAGFGVLLYRLSRNEDLVVGIPAAGQISHGIREAAGSRALVGHCVNTLPLRLSCLGSSSFGAFLKTVKQTMLDAYDHQSMTYGTLLEIVKLPRDLSRPPVVPILFNLDRVASGFRMAHLESNVEEVTRNALVFDLSVNIVDYDSKLQIDWDYNTDLFDAATMRRWLNHYREIMEFVIHHPEEGVDAVPLLDEDSRKQLLVNWNDTAADYPKETTLTALIEEVAQRTPDKVAVEFGEQRITYRELMARVGGLAMELQRLGVERGGLVGVFVERSIDMVIAVLGILHSGGAYVPLDPGFPTERLEFMVEDARVPVIVTQRRMKGVLPRHRGKAVFVEELSGVESFVSDSAARPDSLAYVMFTSGSTGKPKGVQISHRAVVNLLRSMQREPGFSPDDVLLAVTTLSFDIAGLELFLPLVTGAKVVVAPRETVMDGPKLARLIEESGATVMQGTPATWRMLIDSGWQGSKRLKLLCGGEAFGAGLIEPLLERCGQLWNMYGPTETTIWSTTERLLPGQPITIGRPIANTQVFILDGKMQPVPVGVAGDLFIGGDGVAKGYLNRPELTQEKFIANPFGPPGTGRIYGTGDVARFRADGRIDFLGRADHQVKIRGYRIELGEIEAALAANKGVAQAVVVVREDSPGDKRLVAYVVASHDPSPAEQEISVRGVSTADLRARLRVGLPEYMVPSTFVVLERLPLTPNGKVDRKALPKPQESDVGAGRVFESPQGPVEEKLARIMASLLKVSRVGRNEDFFDLGGHSLLAVAFFGEIEREFGRRLPLVTLFRAPTVEQLAKLLDAPGERFTGWSSLVGIRTHGSKPRLFCVHGAGGNLLLYRDLIRRLGDDYPFYGLQSQGLDGKSAPLKTVEEMASRYVREIRELQPDGPYCLGGYCLGGTIAYEIARLLRQDGHDVPLLALFDTYNFSKMNPPKPWAYLRQKARFHLGNLARLRLGNWPGYLSSKMREARDGEMAGFLSLVKWGRRRHESRSIPAKIHEINDMAAAAFQPKPYPNGVTVFRPKANYHCFPDPQMGWGDLAGARLEIVELPVNPHAMLVEPYVQHLADELRRRLDEVQRETNGRRVAPFIYHGGDFSMSGVRAATN